MGWNSLHGVCMRGKANDIEEEIMKKGTIIDEQSELTQMIPLHKACQYGHVRCVEELIKYGTNINMVNAYGSTCLHWAVKGYIQNKDEKTYNEEHYILIVKMLLGISSKLLSVKNKKGDTAFDLIQRAGDGVHKMRELLTVSKQKFQKRSDEREKNRTLNRPKTRRLDET